MSRFRPMLPGPTIGVGDRDTSAFDPEFTLQAHPTGDRVTLHEVLPTTSQVPVPFEATHVRWFRPMRSDLGRESYNCTADVSALAVYTPTGSIGDQGVHCACRATLAAPDRRDPAEIRSQHKHFVWDGLDGDPERDIFGDWATTSLTERTIDGYTRTEFSVRYPRLIIESLNETVAHPMTAQAFAVQSTDWGILETCAYLTPKPNEGRVVELVDSLATSMFEWGRDPAAIDVPDEHTPWVDDD